MKAYEIAQMPSLATRLDCMTINHQLPSVICNAALLWLLLHTQSTSLPFGTCDP